LLLRTRLPFASRTKRAPGPAGGAELDTMISERAARAPSVRGDDRDDDGSVVHARLQSGGGARGEARAATTKRAPAARSRRALVVVGRDETATATTEGAPHRR
jgi:hypothetical protein